MLKITRLTSFLMLILCILLLWGIAIADDSVNTLLVASEEEMFTRIQSEVGVGTSPSVDSIGEITALFQVFKPSDNFFLCTMNENGTCKIVLSIKEKTLCYDTLSLDDTRVMSAIVFLNVSKFHADNIRFCCEKGIWEDESASLLYSDQEVIDLGKAIYQRLLDDGRIVEPTAEPTPCKTPKPVLTPTPTPIATPKPVYNSLSDLPFSPSYDVAKQRLIRLDSYTHEYKDNLTNIPKYALVQAADIQLWDIPIEMGVFKEDNYDYVQVLDPCAFTENNTIRRDWYVNAFRTMYEQLKILYGDYSAYYIESMDQQYSLTGDPDWGQITWLMNNNQTIIRFDFGNFVLAVEENPWRTVCLYSRNLSEHFLTDHSSELSLSSIPVEPYQRQECSKIVFPQYDQRIIAFTEGIITSTGEITIPKEYPLSKLGKVDELKKFYSFCSGLDGTIWMVERLKLCETSMFGYPINSIQIPTDTKSFLNDTIRFYPFQEYGLGGQMDMFVALYEAMKSKLGEPTSYECSLHDVAYKLSFPLNYNQIYHQKSNVKSAFELAIHFRNFTLVWASYDDLYKYASPYSYGSIYVRYDPKVLASCSTLQLNECLPSFPVTETVYKHEKPTYDKNDVEEARLEDPYAVYVYDHYLVDDSYNTGIALYKSISAERDWCPLKIGDAGYFSTVHGDEAVAIQLVNTSGFRDVDSYTIVGYCLDAYENPIYGCGYYDSSSFPSTSESGGTFHNAFKKDPTTDTWFTFTFNNTIKAGAKGKSGKLVFEGIQKPKYVYLAIKSVHTTNGDINNIDDRDLSFVYWKR